MESLSSTDSEAVPASWVVHKFGGTSVGTPDSMRKCIEIVKPYIQSNSSSTNGNSNNSDGHNDSKAGATNIAVVVSAMGGKPKVTDLLLDLVHAAAANRQEEIAAKMHTITEKHRNCANQILSGSPEVAVIIRQIESDLKDIADLLRAVSLMKVPHEQILELVSGYGEIWSATIMTEAMKMQGLPFIFLNARDVLFVSETETGTNIHWDESEQKLNQFINSKDLYNSSNSAGPRHLMITGYVASTLSGIATTLKRDGSDFSASIFGRLLNAKTVTIWTDVSGVFSADPRRVPDARVIPDVSYTEAVELAYFGAKVIHPKT